MFYKFISALATNYIILINIKISLILIWSRR